MRSHENTDREMIGTTMICCYYDAAAMTTDDGDDTNMTM
jgi:hypothetical protein